MNFLINNSQEQNKQNRKTKAEVVADVETFPPGFTGSIDDVFGMWKDKAFSLEEIREQQWLRKTK